MGEQPSKFTAGFMRFMEDNPELVREIVGAASMAQLEAEAADRNADETAQNTEIQSAKNQISSHVANTSNPHATTAAQVGLGLVDNTQDINKPVSGPQQSALDLKAIDTQVVHKAGSENVAGRKTFESGVVFTPISDPASPSGILYAITGLILKWSGKRIPLSGSSSAYSANKALTTDSNGDLVTEDKNSAYNVNFGTGVNESARGNHSHVVAEITGLQTALDSKLDKTKYKKKYSARFQANSSGIYTWTFPAAFDAAPIVNVTVEAPTGAMGPYNAHIHGTPTTTSTVIRAFIAPASSVSLVSVVNLTLFQPAASVYVHITAEESNVT